MLKRLLKTRFFVGTLVLVTILQVLVIIWLFGTAPAVDTLSTVSQPTLVSLSSVRVVSKDKRSPQAQPPSGWDNASAECSETWCTIHALWQNSDGLWVANGPDLTKGVFALLPLSPVNITLTTSVTANKCASWTVVNEAVFTTTAAGPLGVSDRTPWLGAMMATLSVLASESTFHGISNDTAVVCIGCHDDALTLLNLQVLLHYAMPRRVLLVPHARASPFVCTFYRRAVVGYPPYLSAAIPEWAMASSKQKPNALPKLVSLLMRAQSLLSPKFTAKAMTSFVYIHHPSVVDPAQAMNALTSDTILDNFVNITTTNMLDLQQPIKDSLTVIRQARVIVAPTQPALFVLMPLLSPGSTIVELFPPFSITLSYQLLLARLSLRHITMPTPFSSESLHIGHSQDRNLVIERLISNTLEYRPSMILDESWLSQSMRELDRLDTALNSMEKYLLFQPWEQLNNQLIGFRCACAIATFLNRTLVLPYLSYRRDASQRWNFDFAIEAFTWRPMELYFDLSMLHRLPCRTMPYSSFRAVTGNRGAERLIFNPLFNHTTQAQMEIYYDEVLHLPFKSVVYTQRLDQLSEGKIKSYYGSLDDQILPLGVAYWLHDFGHKLRYPYREYHDVMNNTLYFAINRHLQPRSDLVNAARDLVRQIARTGPLLALHARVGQDYELKCGKIQNTDTRARCLPGRQVMLSRVLDVIQHHHKEAETGSKVFHVYVMADQPTFEIDPENVLSAVGVQRVFSRIDVVKIFDGLDPIEVSILEQRISVEANIFIGNIFSSFSRTVFEQRQIANKTFLTW